VTIRMLFSGKTSQFRTWRQMDRTDSGPFSDRRTPKNFKAERAQRDQNRRAGQGRSSASEYPELIASKWVYWDLTASLIGAKRGEAPCATL
jgi:hypothetical protein